MGRFEMNGVDLEKLQMAHAILSQVVDSLVESDEIELEVEFEPLPERIEIDGLTPHRHYQYDDDCCEGMRW
jgi:hypothetical protein